MTREIGVAVAGFGWMGRAHTHGYARVRHHFPALPLAPRLVAVADEVPGRAEEACAQYGFTTPMRDWRDLAANPAVGAVSVTAPNFLHREMGAGLAAAGKHIWIEKPVGLTAADARAVAAAVRSAGVVSCVGFNYRQAPAVAQARALVSSGAIGRVTNARFRLFSDYAAHPEGALTWRYYTERGGAGVLGDLASHGVDLVRYVLGDIESVVADTGIFVAARALPSAATSGHQRVSGGGEMGAVENEDFLTVLMRLRSGAKVSMEASRVAVGAQNDYGFVVSGTQGSVAWDYRQMGVLTVSIGSGGAAEYQDQSVTTRYVGPGAGAYGAFQPGSANPMSFDDLKVTEAALFLTAIAGDAAYRPSGLDADAMATVEDAVAAFEVMDAMVASVGSGRWETV